MREKSKPRWTLLAYTTETRRRSAFRHSWIRVLTILWIPLPTPPQHLFLSFSLSLKQTLLNGSSDSKVPSVFCSNTLEKTKSLFTRIPSKHLASHRLSLGHVLIYEPIPVAKEQDVMIEIYIPSSNSLKHEEGVTHSRCEEEAGSPGGPLEVFEKGHLSDVWCSPKEKGVVSKPHFTFLQKRMAPGSHLPSCSLPCLSNTW